jgi:putative tryptophan/tyrosine transport system substrate-binding protein
MGMNRRAFVTGLGSLLTAPLATHAQPSAKVPRVGVMGVVPTPHLVEAWRQGLREHGWVEGQNILVEYRYSQANDDLFPGFAAELVRLKVDVIVAVTDAAIHAARRSTTTIPIVMAARTEPIASGFVASLARPGGNITGMPMFADELAGKQLQLLKEMLPGASRVAILVYPNHAGPKSWDAAASVAPKIGLNLQRLDAQAAGDLEAILTSLSKSRPDALVVQPSPLYYMQTARIAEAAAKHRLPTMYSFRESAEAGGLIAYTTMLPELFRRVAGYVDKVLRGAKAAEMPVEQPAKFELVINMKTARALGLTIPQSLILRADHVIE